MSQDNETNNESVKSEKNAQSDTMKIIDPITPEGAEASRSDNIDLEEVEELEVEELEVEEIEESDTSEDNSEGNEAEPYIPPTEEEWNGFVDEYERVKAELESMTTRLKSLSVAYTKKQEEVEKIRKRFQRDAKLDEVKRRGDVVKVLFEPLENLKRSIETQRKSDIDEAHIQGLEFVQKNFMKCFHNMGLEEIPGVGSKFDPNLHDALMSMPVDQEIHDNVIMNVHSTGYRIEGIILRPAQVIVGKYTPPPKDELAEESKEDLAEEPVENEENEATAIGPEVVDKGGESTES